MYCESYNPQNAIFCIHEYIFYHTKVVLKAYSCHKSVGYNWNYLSVIPIACCGLRHGERFLLSLSANTVAMQFF